MVDTAHSNSPHPTLHPTSAPEFLLSSGFSLLSLCVSGTQSAPALADILLSGTPPDRRRGLFKLSGFVERCNPAQLAAFTGEPAMLEWLLTAESRCGGGGLPALANSHVTAGGDPEAGCVGGRGGAAGWRRRCHRAHPPTPHPPPTPSATLLHMACEGFAARVQRSVAAGDGAPPNLDGYLPTLTFLMSLGVPPAAVNGCGETALHLLAETPGTAPFPALSTCASLASALVGGEPSLLGAADEAGNTALGKACVAGNGELLRTLVDCGGGWIALAPLVSATNTRGQNLLHLACKGGLVDAVNGILAAAGGGKAALVAAVDGGKRSSLMYAAWAERGTGGPLCSALIGAGADPGAKDAKGRTMEAYAHVGAAAT